MGRGYFLCLSDFESERFLYFTQILLCDILLGYTIYKIKYYINFYLTILKIFNYTINNNI